MKTRLLPKVVRKSRKWCPRELTERFEEKLRSHRGMRWKIVSAFNGKTGGLVMAQRSQGGGTKIMKKDKDTGSGFCGMCTAQAGPGGSLGFVWIRSEKRSRVSPWPGVRLRGSHRPGTFLWMSRKRTSKSVNDGQTLLIKRARERLGFVGEKDKTKNVWHEYGLLQRS